MTRRAPRHLGAPRVMCVAGAVSAVRTLKAVAFDEGYESTAAEPSTRPGSFRVRVPGEPAVTHGTARAHGAAYPEALGSRRTRSRSSRRRSPRACRAGRRPRRLLLLACRRDPRGLSARHDSSPSSGSTRTATPTRPRHRRRGTHGHGAPDGDRRRQRAHGRRRARQGARSRSARAGVLRGARDRRRHRARPGWRDGRLHRTRRGRARARGRSLFFPCRVGRRSPTSKRSSGCCKSYDCRRPRDHRASSPERIRESWRNSRPQPASDGPLRPEFIRCRHVHPGPHRRLDRAQADRPAERDCAHPNTCPECGSHYREEELSSTSASAHTVATRSGQGPERVAQLADPGTFEEEDADLRSADRSPSST